jgi:hypothetical protein
VSRSILWLGFMLSLFAATSIDGIAQTENPPEQKSLRGLQGVSVQVMRFDSPEGVSLKQIQTDVELRIRKAGIRVVPFSSVAQLPGQPFLWISVLALKNPVGVSVYSVNLELWQDVRLKRNLAIGVSAATYTVEPRLVVVDSRNIRQLREDLSDCVDAFINDYLAMNPK